MPEVATPETARLLQPSDRLCACVRAFVMRSTVGLPTLPEAARYNHFPASPLCSITWFVEGETMPVDGHSGERGDPYCRVVFGGPQTKPRITFNPGPVRAFMVMFYPDALHRLIGVDVSQYTDLLGPMPQALGQDWATLTDAVLAAADDAERQRLIEAFLEPRWRMSGEAVTARNWLRRLALRAEAGGWGVRNLERRMRAWAGLPMRTLRRLDRAEQSFLRARAAILAGKADWAELAQRAGYADQAHLCRETRQITGLSPANLARAGMSDECFWVYRIWS
jgi:AraC-like DNA-binding protein